jgi:hypothetical protein
MTPAAMAARKAGLQLVNMSKAHLPNHAMNAPPRGHPTEIIPAIEAKLGPANTSTQAAVGVARLAPSPRPYRATVTSRAIGSGLLSKRSHARLAAGPLDEGLVGSAVG